MLGIMMGTVWLLNAGHRFATGQQLWMFFAILGCIGLVLGVYDIIARPMYGSKRWRKKAYEEFYGKKKEASNNDETKGEK